LLPPSGGIIEAAARSTAELNEPPRKLPDKPMRVTIAFLPLRDMGMSTGRAISGALQASQDGTGDVRL